MPAFYSRSIDEFLAQGLTEIVGQLTAAGGSAGFFQQLHSQTAAWQLQIEILREALTGLKGYILLEYPIPRRGKRLDAVLLIGGLIVALEFKCGARYYDRLAITQVEDYCLDLRDFHRESRGRIIVPVVVATDAPAGEFPSEPAVDSVTQAHPIDPQAWDYSDYSPTPTIIEAAQTVMRGTTLATFLAAKPATTI